jgi:short-subunit dehydrogenase
MRSIATSECSILDSSESIRPDGYSVGGRRRGPTGSVQAVYNASKSFVQSFALALREELKDSGVIITSLMPGPTDTEFFERADMLDTKVGSEDKDDPAEVAREGFEALMAGKERVVSASLKTKLQGRASRVLPYSAKAAMHRKMAEPGSAKK